MLPRMKALPKEALPRIDLDIRRAVSGCRPPYRMRGPRPVRLPRPRILWADPGWAGNDGEITRCRRALGHRSANKSSKRRMTCSCELVNDARSLIAGSGQLNSSLMPKLVRAR